ncbi:ferrous iron transport protein B [Portibacter lacus]|uniref:Ferrous iron transport protein B n=1 Tax=Portibacter lacus TaxID=1099794 RepID=A0AA37SST7_9BACT|nr:ferrous iron transport protein B [Portibacter lacus]GLR19149.1 ferrous iron transport protein B [Portibacter lacus]
MSKKEKQIVALIGNPNSGKSSLFNILTGLRQQVGNFPGVTVDKKIGSTDLGNNNFVDIIDLPGTYSMYPNSSDERIVTEILTNPDNPNFPDAIIYVLDVMNMERHLLLASQLIDLQIPMVLALNMTDIAEKEGLVYDSEYLEKKMGVKIVPISCREEKNIDILKATTLEKLRNPIEAKSNEFYSFSKSDKAVIEKLQPFLKEENKYRVLLVAHHHHWLKHISAADRINIKNITDGVHFESIKSQINETMSRFAKFTPFVRQLEAKANPKSESVTDAIDNVITHRVFGPIIFFGIMLLVFQVIFSWSEYPMTWIEDAFAWGENTVKDLLPDGWFTRLLTEGIIAGLGGIMVFIPQILFLFLLISLLEEVGYMSRAVFMFDKLFQKFGLNGRSIVALVSSGACAIPAIMSTRTISNWRERLITIMVAPLISCSARIPVYTVLIGFVVPAGSFMGFNQQGLAFMGLYLLSIVAALGSAMVFNIILKKDNNSYLMMELPIYKPPIWKNIFYNVKEKVLAFIVEAGKVIFVISIILWFLASYGPAAKMKMAETQATEISAIKGLDDEASEQLLASLKIENSYAGHLGKFIEPVIKPLGFDWKIGIALITSFAAREVFVGTMATIYSIGGTDDESTIRERMASEVDPITGKPIYGFATSLSLLIFYVFAMQCMSTLAVTKRETKSWKWPIIQFVYMSALAYLGSLLVYQLFA